MEEKKCPGTCTEKQQTCIPVFNMEEHMVGNDGIVYLRF